MKTKKVFRLTTAELNTHFKLEQVEVYVKPNGAYDHGYSEYIAPDLAKGLDLTNVKTIYFTPNVTVPRERVRPFLEDKGIKIIRDHNKADVIITHDNYYKNNNHMSYYNYTSVEGMKYFLNNFKDDCNAKDIIQQLDALTDPNDLVPAVCLFQTSDLLGMYVQHHINPNKNHYSRYSIESDDFGNSYDRARFTIIEDMGIYLSSILAKSYDQEEILSMLGDVTLDKDSYESIKSMFNSMDKTNHTMAMTVMANTNYEKSFMYLALLLEEFGPNQIYNCAYRNTVAFKSLVNWMGYHKYRFDKDAIFEISLEKKLLTPELLAIIKKEYLGKSDTFSSNYDIVDIKLTAEAQEKVDKLFKEKGYDNGLPSGGELLQQEISL